jgi:hypothetical protein
LNVLLVSDQDEFEGVVVRQGVEATLNDRARGVVAPHRVDRKPH